MMNRRDFLQRLAACGLVAASPRFIFDLGKNLHKKKTVALGYPVGGFNAPDYGWYYIQGSGIYINPSPTIEKFEFTYENPLPAPLVFTARQSFL